MLGEGGDFSVSIDFCDEQLTGLSASRRRKACEVAGRHCLLLPPRPRGQRVRSFGVKTSFLHLTGWITERCDLIDTKKLALLK